MKPIDATHFARLKYATDPIITPSGELIFILSEADIENNSYKSGLFRYVDGNNDERICAADDIKAMYFCGSRFFMISSIKEESIISEWDSRTRQFVEIFRSEKDISRALPYGSGKWLLLSRDDLKQKEEKDLWYIVEETPAFINGEGFRSRIRTRLYLYNETSSTSNLLTPEYMDVGSIVLAGTDAIFFAAEYDTVKPTVSKLYSLSEDDSQSITITCIDRDEYVYTDLISNYPDETLIAIRNDRKQYGEYQDEYIDLINPGNSEVKRLNGDCGLHLCNGVNCDIVYCAAGQRFIPIDSGEGVLFIATASDATEVWRGDFNKGTVEKLTNFSDMLISDFAVRDYSDSGIILAANKGLGGIELWDAAGTRLTFYNQEIEKEYSAVTPERRSFISKVDGAKFFGYILHPLIFEPDMKYPVVLCIHGGPNTAYNACFHHEMQLLAANGYGVIFCNPHGSIGYGPEFENLRDKYYTVDKEDIIQFLNEILNCEKWIDKTRIGLAGGSYGGMMINHLVTHTDRFKAAVSDRSVSNEISDFFLSDIGLTYSIDVHGGSLWDENVFGKTWTDSSIRLAPEVSTPMLFIHGEVDYTCTVNQSLQMHAALQYCGVPSRVFIAKGEAHGLSFNGSPLPRIRRLEEILAWFKKYL